ncbi:hypothetical protein GGI43DRAFT_430070 [Trichoderma evansii]
MARANNNHKTRPDHESQTSATSDYKRNAVYSPSEWLLETLSSIAALGLVIGVSTFIGQAKWLYFKSKPCRLADFEIFNKASRDVWGSLLLLTTVKWNLATVGAVLMILRLFFSPFAQQVVLIEQRDVISPASDNATFGYAYNYSRTALLTAVGSTVDSVGSYPQDAGMQSAIFQGLYGVNTTEPSTALEHVAGPNHIHHLETTEQCTMTTPGGVMLGTRYYQNNFATEYYMNTTSLIGDSRPYDLPELARFGIYRSTPDRSYANQNLNITECSLYLTAYQYTDAEANGSDFSFTRQEVDFGPGNPWYAVPMQRDDSYARFVTANITWNNNSIPALEVDYPNLQTLTTFLMSSSIINEFVDGNFINSSLGVAAALTGNVNLSDRFDGMATSMTNYLRYGLNSQLALGEVLQSEPFISIRWWYFVVPVMIEALAIVFTILSIVANRRSRNVPLWKSSTLAVLACQHNEQQLEVLQTTGKNINELEAEAKKVQVQLQHKII